MHRNLKYKSSGSSIYASNHMMLKRNEIVYDEKAYVMANTKGHLLSVSELLFCRNRHMNAEPKASLIAEMIEIAVAMCASSNRKTIKFKGLDR